MLKRFILWDFPRGGWQYDVMVGLILAFIFLTPRGWFRDQPRIPNSRIIAMLPSEHGGSVFFINRISLAATPESDRIGRVTELLRADPGFRNLTVTRVEPIRDSEGDLEGFIAFAKPQSGRM